MIPYYIIFYFIALVASLVTFKKYFDTPLKIFPLLIAYTFFNEILGYFVLFYEEFSFFDEEEYSWHTVIIYNIYDIFFYTYLYWLYYKLLKDAKNRLLVKVFAAITLVAVLISLFFQDPFHSGLYFANCLACIFIIIIISLHFQQLYRLNKTQPSRYNHMIWFNIGMLVFHFFYPFYVLNGYHNVEFFLEYNLRLILWWAISIMYVFFIIGFLLGKRPYFG
ncbi:hypothetical protein [Croceivirga thetidis]|uniref:Uncharacterized protein n=1 Tax=Croceivirga thetidis TaxID=2721623 RepID=A0ABX1GSZ4_9FLAO|nr:hypothetical protein [Croceivirga thetidis]NKI33083.1 hypothetical protein [Croceivirga thetidis]